MIKKLFLIYGLILPLSLAGAGTIDPSTDDNKYLEYGQKFEYVGKIHGTSSYGKDFYGSCVVCKDNIVMTAAHIAKDIETANVTVNNRTIKIVKYITHPMFARFGKDYDIAICLLENDTGLQWYPSLYKEKNELNKICCLSGYGITGTFNSTYRKSDGKRRAGSNRINIIENNTMVCDASKNDKTELEFLISYGDSGGGLFVDNCLAGINSAIVQTYIGSVLQNDYRTLSYHVRISSHIEWIENTIKFLSNKEEK